MIPVPEHLIVDNILPRLPVKTLIRFKSVSKYWFTTISSSEFAKTQLNFSQRNSNNKFFFILTSICKTHRKLWLFVHEERKNKFMLLPYDDELNELKNPIELDFTLFDSRFETYQSMMLMGSSNGLVCFKKFYMSGKSCFTCFYICNPASHEYCEIDIPNSNHRKFWWFGYVPSVDDYKIVVVYEMNKSDDYYGDPHELYVYSLRMRKWTRCDGVVHLDPLYDHLGECTRVYNDVLYWSPTTTRERSVYLIGCRRRNPKRIVGFDLVSEQVKVVPWMDWLNAYYQRADFFLLNGRLSLYCRCSHLSYESDVWMLKQHDDWNSWEKAFTVHNVKMRRSNPLVSTPTGKLLVHNRFVNINNNKGPDLYEFRIIDITKNNAEEQSQGKNTNDYLHDGVYYVESLISPFRTS